MSLTTSADRILITDTDGTVVFDTNERQFTATNGPLTGTVTTSAITTTTAQNFQRDTVLAAINAAANTVRGATSIVVSGANQGLINKGWFNASGSLITGLREVWPVLSASTNTVGIGSIVSFAFIASGGSLILREHHRLSPPRNTSGITAITVPAHSFTYHLFAGTFV